MQNTMLRIKRLGLLWSAVFLLGSCQSFQEDLDLLDFANFQNVLFDLKCGDYTFATFNTHEKCGGDQNSFGYLYAQDKVVKLLLSPTEGENTLLYVPIFTILLHPDYLKEGTTLGKDQVIATCSRFQKEFGNDPSYYTVPAKSVTLKLVEYKGEQKHRILDDHTRWVFEWDVKCPDLAMTAKGKDQIDISLDPTPARWKNADGGALPPAPPSASSR